MLAQDIPQGNFHGGQGAHQHRAAPPIGVAVNIMEMALNIQGILAHQIFLDVFHCAQQGLFLVFQGSFTHAVNSLISVYLDEDPIGAEAIHHKRFYIDNFHPLISLSVYLFSGEGGKTFLHENQGRIQQGQVFQHIVFRQLIDGIRQGVYLAVHGIDQTQGRGEAAAV